MHTNISLTISTILFHTICANRKITCKAVKHFSVLNYPLVQRAKCLFQYEFFVNILQSMMMNRFIIMLS